MKKVLTVLIMSAILTTLSFAQWVGTNGPFGGAVRKLTAIGTTLFAATENVGVSLSTNNGANWTVVNTGLPPSPFVHTLVASGANLFASVSTWGVYLSTNNGTSWTQINNGLTDTRVMALSVSGSTLFVATLGGIFRSTDSGANWTLVSSDLTGTSVPSLAISGPNIYAGTDGRGMFVSTNNGTSWAFSNSGFPSPTTTTIHSLLVSGANIFAGYHRGVVLSTNNGSTWTTVNTGFPNATINIMSLVTSGGSLFAAASGTGVYRSTNNGASWTTFNTGLLNMTIMSLTVVGTDLFSGTFGSGAWRILIPTSVKEVGNENPESFSLEQNYPNPFNPTTSIRFNVLGSGLVSLKVFDVLGKEIATLVNEHLNAGTYETRFDAAGLSSGTYYYRLQSGAAVQTRKLVLMK